MACSENGWWPEAKREKESIARTFLNKENKKKIIRCFYDHFSWLAILVQIEKRSQSDIIKVKKKTNKNNCNP